MKRHKPIEIPVKQESAASVAWYQSKLMLLKTAMYRDYLLSIKNFYKENYSYLVKDDDPIIRLNAMIDALGEKWSRAFNSRSLKLSRKAMMDANRASQKKFESIYKKYPNRLSEPQRLQENQFETEILERQIKEENEQFKKQQLTPAKNIFKQPLPEPGFFEIVEFNQQRFTNPFIILPNMAERNAKVNIIESGIAENVALIKSIPKQFHDQVQGAVMRNVAVGGNAKKLVEELSKISDRSSKRVKLIANDQIAKATALLDQQEAIEMGFTKGKWQKSIAGKTHRKTHAEANNKEFDINKGCLIEGEYIMPRWKINCKCSYKLILE
jgi:uncharacterized protein with gpF-like domain